jgi:hypothetical protein
LRLKRVDRGNQTASLGVILEQRGERKTETRDKLSTVEILAELEHLNLRW